MMGKVSNLKGLFQGHLYFCEQMIFPLGSVVICSQETLCKITQVSRIVQTMWRKKLATSLISHLLSDVSWDACAGMAHPSIF